MQIIYRRLTSADAAAYQAIRVASAALHPASFLIEPDQEAARDISWYASFLADAAELQVVGAFEKGLLIGIIGLRRDPRPKTRHKANLFGVYLTAGYRGRGIAQNLLAHTLQAARLWPDVRQLNLSVHTRNPAAQALYANAGFEVWGHEKASLWVNGEWFDEWHMTLRLDAQSGGEDNRT